MTVWNLPENEQKLISLWAAGFSAAKIAKAIGGGISRNAVIGKVHRLGLPQRGSATKRDGGRHKSRRTGLKPLNFARRRPPLEGCARAATPPPRLGSPRTFSTPPHERIHLLETGLRHCRFIEGNDSMCCGRETPVDSSWCDDHYRMVFRKKGEPWDDKL